MVRFALSNLSLGQQFLFITECYMVARTMKQELDGDAYLSHLVAEMKRFRYVQHRLARMKVYQVLANYIRQDDSKAVCFVDDDETPLGKEILAELRGSVYFV